MVTQQNVVFNTLLREVDILPENNTTTTPNSGWVNLPLVAMLLRRDPPGNGEAWFARPIGEMKDYGSITAILTTGGGAEITSSGYTRQVLTPNQIQLDTGGDFSRFRIAEASTIFGNPVGDTGAQQTIEAVLVYSGVVDSASDATNIPLVMQEYATGKQTADGPVTANWTNQALWAMRQA